MVLSELAAATMIAVYGFKNSYRIILKGERLVRRRIRRPSPIIGGYDSFPRLFIRRVFRAGLVIAMRWEGRVKNAAQLAADARMRARSASDAVATRVEAARARAENVRKRASDVRTKAQDQAAMVREKAAEVRQRAGEVKDAAIAAKDRAVAAKDRVVEIKNRVQERISPSASEAPDASRKLSTGGPAASRKREEGVSSGKRPFHSSGLVVSTEPESTRFLMVRTRFA